MLLIPKRLFPFSTDGAARILFYHLMQRLAFKLTSVESHRTRTFRRVLYHLSYCPTARYIKSQLWETKKKADYSPSYLDEKMTLFSGRREATGGEKRETMVGNFVGMVNLGTI